MDFRTPQWLFNKMIPLVQDRIRASTGKDMRILFYYSTPLEFIEQVGSLPEDSKYPFLFINSIRSRMIEETSSGWVWDLPDIVLAAKSKADWIREQRDRYNFKPILNPVLNELRSMWELSRYMNVTRKPTYTPHYFYGVPGENGYESHRFNQAIDAWQINNLQITITKQC